jgi:hypothetical protein
MSFMATSSIFNRIEVNTPADAERVVSAMEEAYRVAKDTTRKAMKLGEPAKDITLAQAKRLFGRKPK